MKLVDYNAEIIAEQNPYKKVELVGRMCYKSEDKITDTSYIKFVRNLIDRKHFAMLEHGWLTFEISGIGDLPDDLKSLPFSEYEVVSSTPCQERFIIHLSLSHLYNPRYDNISFIDRFRHVAENWYLPNDVSFCDHSASDDLQDVIISLTNPSEYTRRYSVKFTCDRGVSHELVRHRCCVAQSSTRYCNYAKEKFGSQLTFVKPSTYDSWSDESKDSFIDACKNSEILYMKMITDGRKPEEARAVLNNALMTEVVLTMSYNQWQHFFDMRYRGITGSPHPDMKVVASIAINRLETEYHILF